jgi:hypothetical protein
MTDSQENKLTMYQAVLALLASFISIWTGKPVIVAAKTFIEDRIARIRLYRQIQEKDTKGITISKDAIETNLIKATLKVVDGLVPHATATNNQELLKSIDYKPSDLKYTRDNYLIDKCKLVYNTADALRHELESYEVTDVDIMAISTLLGQYEIIVPAKRVSVTAQKVATAGIKTEIKEIDLHLKNNLDNLMLMFRSNKPDFYDGYKASRIIINLGQRTTGSKTIYSGTVLNFSTGLPEAGVTVTITETGKFLVTGADGRFSFALTKGGTFTLKAEKAGFTTWNEDTTLIETGAQIDIEINLEPIEA